jgi:hypothetical protein
MPTVKDKTKDVHMRVSFDACEAGTLGQKKTMARMLNYPEYPSQPSGNIGLADNPIDAWLILSFFSCVFLGKEGMSTTLR